MLVGSGSRTPRPLTVIPTHAATTLNGMNGSHAEGKANLNLNVQPKSLTIVVAVSGFKAGKKYTGVITLVLSDGTLSTLASGTAVRNGNLSIKTVIPDLNGIPGNWDAVVVPYGSSNTGDAVVGGPIMYD